MSFRFDLEVEVVSVLGFGIGYRDGEFMLMLPFVVIVAYRKRF